MKILMLILLVISLFPCQALCGNDKLIDLKMLGAGISCIRHYDPKNLHLFNETLINEISDRLEINRSETYEAINTGKDKFKNDSNQFCSTFTINSAMIIKKYSNNSNALYAMQLLANKLNGKDFFYIDKKISANKNCIEKELPDENVTLSIKRNSNGETLQIQAYPELIENDFPNLKNGDILNLTLG